MKPQVEAVIVFAAGVIVVPPVLAFSIMYAFWMVGCEEVKRRFSWSGSEQRSSQAS